MRIAAVQTRSVWLDAGATTDKALGLMAEAARQGATCVVFPETFLPGYPFWLSMTSASRFEDTAQKQAYAAYLDAAVTIPGPEIHAIAGAAREHGLFAMVGVAERGAGTASGSIYCSLVTISPDDGIVGVHRKLVPTYEERLVWAPGDGNGLRTHQIGDFRVGGLCCYENWMPLARHALYGDGETLHVSVWPGSGGNTTDCARFIAMEGRVYSLAASGLTSAEDVPKDFPLRQALEAAGGTGHDGGSAIAGPDGAWLVPPLVGEESVIVADLDPAVVRGARQNLDPTGHYSRPDVFQMTVDRRRAAAVRFIDSTDVDSTEER
ncbi:carbon-nitrogen hydrolase family protein [Nonomuraea guangzhouensis]|uniref:Carbon-nitrogen hydrolase family protein n=1 Tax=Nonomuraea guangzhouensis TaxID=1291555 RepID=A0ABW4GXB7_9ACTN|nr:carbon-nitrogen hydrolase family protein [Nonomuraea guangzhouensis]